MASNEDSDVVAARIREHALKVIRDEYPYMKEAALQDIANSLQATTRKQIVAQYVSMGLNCASRRSC